MDNINDIKNRIKKKKLPCKEVSKENINYPKYLKRLFFRSLIVTILVLSFSIFFKKNLKYKNMVYENVYNNYLSFAFIKKYYNKYLGNVIPFEDIKSTKTVFNDEKITYEEKSTFNNGVKLKVKDNYLVPILNDGIVIFVGEKENLGNTIIIEDENKINYLYGNMDSINISLYDYVSKGDILGTVKDNTLYLIFQKDGKYLDYKEYIK